MKFDEKELEQCKEIAARSTNPCITATYIAFSDKKVIELLENKIDEGHIYKENRCLKEAPNFELVYVYFDFECNPEKLCKLDPSFVAVVNLTTQHVQNIINPYIESNILNSNESVDSEISNTSLRLATNRTYITLGNHTGRDIHVEVTGDVHTGLWGPNQINNNHSPEIKSRKISFGNRANYHFKVWKNDNGRPGQFIGEFDHSVRYNLAGNRDHLEFVIISLNNQYYLQVVSARLLGEIIIRILLTNE